MDWAQIMLREYHSSINPSTIFRVILIFAILLIIGLMIFSFGIGAYTFFGTEMIRSGSSRVVGHIPFFFIGQLIIANAPITVSHLFTALWAVYAVLFTTALFGPNASALKVLKQVRGKGLGVLLENGITTVAATFPILASVISLIDFLQEQVGIPTGSLPEQDPAVAFTYTTLAPIVEEVGFRVSIIGLIIALWLVAQGGWLKALKALIFPTRYIDPFKREARSALVVIIVAIVISAILFGYAHVAMGGGWKLGKVSTTILAGLVLGWVYVKRGLPATILLHWSFNYFTGSYYYFDKALNTPTVTFFVDGVIICVGVLTAVALGAWFFRRSALESSYDGSS